MIKINNNENSINTSKVDNVEVTEYLNSNNIVKVSDNELLNYALHYAKMGYPLIPLHNVIINKDFKRCSCADGRFCEKPGKHPRTRKGHKNATTDQNRILEWWTKCPNANIGILTGVKTGIFVLDIDVKHGGEDSFETIKDYYRCELNDDYDCEGTLTSYSGSRGRHLIYKHPMEYKIRSSESRIDAGLDIKGEESYIVAPPSNHWSGRKYSWHGVNTPVTEAPDWLIYEIAKLEDEPSARKPTSFEPISVGKIPERERNSYLSAQARGLVNSFSEKAGREILLKKNKEKLIEPLSDREVERIVKKTWKKFGKNQNREIGLKK